MLQPVLVNAYPRRWRPAPVFTATLALHLLALVLVLERPAFWPWSVALVVFNHLWLTAAGLWPRSRLLGPNQTRLSAEAAAAGYVAITIDDGPDPLVTPQVLELLARHRCRATFFCIGERVAAHPKLARQILAAGHDIENHTQHHRHQFSLLGPRRMAREIEQGQRSIAALGGEPPRFFRAPAGLRNPFLEPVLCRLGLKLVSWTRRGFDTVTADPQKVLARLIRRLRAGDILLLHDGHAARTAAGQAVILEVLPPLLAALQRAGLSSTSLRGAL
ncbi:MAG TPA: polysaccharide deacetylase family protein [Steroidobacteraceae bacterium]|nr:polysaccharide deacetylase family protein [Steroidobacteraceae bacterium]